MVTLHSTIVKFILALNLAFTKPQLKHLTAFVHGMILCDGRLNISQIRRYTNEYRHLSCMTRFLNESPWSTHHMKKQRMQFLIEKIKESRTKIGDTRPITFLVIDDTQCKKDSSTTKMEKLDYHYSHADGKSVWSHCLVSAHVVTESYSFTWDFRSYFRKAYCEKHQLPFKSKLDLAVELIQEYPMSEDEQVYVLVDNWYTGRKVIEACSQRGFHLIGGLRPNRKIYPLGIGIKISTFASTYLDHPDLHSVTVNDQKYRVYEYEGELSDTENVKVLLSWEKKFDSNQTPFCVLCTDSSLDSVTILSYYSNRWQIEVGYRYFKELLGFDQYQLLSHKGIERFWNIQFLTYNYLEIQRHQWESGETLTIGDVVRRIRKENLGQLIVYTYEQALAKKPISEVLKELKLTS
jgi:SRSO17 transposase